MRYTHPTTTARPHPRGAATRRPAGGEARSPDLNGFLATLRSTVTSHACLRRAEGVSAEGVLTEISALLCRAELAEGWPDELGVLTAQVRRWSLEAYLDDPALRNVPRFY